MTLRPLLTLALAATLAPPALAASIWLDDFAAAQKAAAATGKPILVDVTGSDWCLPCQQMEAEIFSRPEFVKAATAKYILLRLDFPRTFSLPERLRVQNLKLADRYPFDGFPTTFVMDAQGVLYGKHSGYVEGGVPAFLSLAAAFDAQRPVLVQLTSALAKAAAGTARAQAQDALFRQAEAWGLESQYADLPLKIVQEDKDGKAGLKVRYQTYNAYQRLLATWAEANDDRRTVTTLDALATQAQLWPELRQRILFTKGLVQANALGDEAAAAATLRQARDVMAGTAVAQRAAELLDDLP